MYAVQIKKFFNLSNGTEEDESKKGSYEFELRYGWETEYCDAIKAMENTNPDLYSYSACKEGA